MKEKKNLVEYKDENPVNFNSQLAIFELTGSRETIVNCLQSYHAVSCIAYH